VTPGGTRAGGERGSRVALALLFTLPVVIGAITVHARARRTEGAQN
jgi:hypothetical protein